MGKSEDKRKRIFDKYSSQLHGLQIQGLLPSKHEHLKFVKTYLCPVCLTHFSTNDLEINLSNFLTLEDAPQKSLGGKANTLTCKQCNNTCGREIDFHLVERMFEQDRRKFLPNTKGKGKFVIDGKEVQGEFSVDGNGKITVIHSKKNNHPGKLENYIDNTDKGSIVTIEHKPSRVDVNRLEIALLKTAYILAFEKFGYSIILDECFDIVREQLLNPDKELYPQGFWTKQQIFTEQHEGVLLIETEGYFGLFCVFALKTPSVTKRFGVYLPLPNGDTINVIAKLKDLEGGFALSLNPLLSNFVEELDKAKELIETIKNHHNRVDGREP